MIEVSRVVQAAPATVFAVLADGWMYSGWVVGSSHIRDVDAGWPAVGSRLHHSVGVWPLQLRDTTIVHALEPGSALTLEAQGWPLGTAEVTVTLSGHNGQTLVRMGERALRGLGKLLPEAVQGLVLRPRNRESLARLAALAEGRERRTGQP
ncbi:SRPBCC family protein [Amycolatopsis sp. FDAARGOS 1241]|uniref:SRPBCC family protein n=1 Tax=Amycolatopsis sp. FDAARGOS 1241 TaxID=2778070 RepID=UPI00194F9A5D|nr:SRPBCC family protein [Amycolatopsis sp. FDAARGOS 1241]QRP49696.1 SRPBCC family protein [Amycolatopsis sp. FDAARGOS 1241]